MAIHLRTADRDEKTRCGQAIACTGDQLVTNDEPVMDASEAPRARPLIEALTLELDSSRRRADGSFVPVGDRLGMVMLDRVCAEFTPLGQGQAERKPALCSKCVRAAAEEAAWPEAPLRLEQRELERVARGIAEGRIFTSQQVDTEDLPSVFLSLAVSGLPPADYWRDAGCMWQWTDQSIGSGSHYPAFLATNWLHREDWPKVVELAAEHRKRSA